MKLRIWLEVAGGVLALIVIALLASSWLSARDASVRADAQQKAHAETDLQRAEEIKTLHVQIEQIKADEAKRIEDLRTTFAKPQTPQELAPLIAQLMNLRQPINFVTPPATPENPHPVPVAQVSTEDAPQVKAYVQTCEECKIKLPAAAAQLTASELEKQILANQLVERTQERDTWKTAARGGSFWQRLKRNAKWLAIGAVAGAVAVEAARR